MKKKGTFITFEGIDGAGKTVQIDLLKEKLSGGKMPSLFTREPGGTPLGEEVRGLLLSSEMTLTTEILLYAAARAQHVQEVIVPALEQGLVVVCDRYIHSSLAYQGFGAGAHVEKITRLNDAVTGGLWPDLTIILDIAVEESVRRRQEKKRSTGITDRFEEQDISYYRRVRQGYLTLSSRNPSRLMVISSQGTPRQIHELIWEKIRSVLNGEGHYGF